MSAGLAPLPDGNIGHEQAIAAHGAGTAEDRERPNRTASEMRSATASMPSPVWQLVSNTGRSALTARASHTMRSRSARTYGAKSVLLITSRSQRTTPSPLL